MTHSTRPRVASIAVIASFALLALASGGKREDDGKRGDPSSKNSGGCTADKDCKGSRVCINSVCTNPPTTPTAAATTAPPTTAVATTTLAAPAAGTGTLIVNPPTTSQRGIVRASPSLTAAQVTALDRGTSVTVLEVSNDGQFRRVRWSINGGGEGWMHQDVLSAAGAAPKPGRGSCSRENQFCLLNGTTAGVCMNFGGLICATPTVITHHDGCGTREQACTCSNTRARGKCDLGPLKEGLYCQCS